MAKYYAQQDFNFQAAPDETQKGDGEITVADLAKELGVSPEKVLALASESYLTVIEEKIPPETSVLLKPYPAAMEWLRQALGPVPFSPVVQLQHAASALGMRAGWLRRLVLEYNITLYVDPVLGELMTVGGFYSLIQQIHPGYEKHRFDRQMFFSILSGLHSGQAGDLSQPMDFDQRLEVELARVAKLPVIQREIRAMDIFTAYRDARKVEGVVRKVLGRRTPVAERVNSIMAGWTKRDVTVYDEVRKRRKAS